MLPLQHELERSIEGEVRFDTYSRILYSTDASLYQIEPIGVVLPKNVPDIITTVQIARSYHVPILPRGGGTSLGGQAVGQAVVLDLSKYMNQILEVNQEERWVRVQPGIVLDELNAALRSTGLFFAPDVSPSNRANIGGMIGNNSSGAHSILYGKTIDNVYELKVVLSDGREILCKDLTAEELQAKTRLLGIEGQVYRTIPRIVEQNKEEILKRYPKIMRRVGGYNLDEFVKDQPFNLSKILIGSEGTLAVTTEAKLKLVPRPKMTAVDVIHFHDLLEAMEASQEILQHHPAAVELIDRMIINLTRDSLDYSRKMTFVEGDPAALLFVEFYGESQAELTEKIEDLEAHMKEKGFGFHFVRALDEKKKGDIWAVRKAGLGLLQGLKGDKKPIAFVEDTAVAPEKLAPFVKRFDEIIRAHDTTAGYYGHASVGCLHVRPLIDVKQASEIRKMRSIAEQVLRLTMEFGGAMSAEHGDGLVRSEWNEIFFGTQLYNAFREVKRTFDPQGIMNPGKIVDAPRMDENLRYGASYRALFIPTHLNFSREGGFDRAIEQCNGMAICRKTLEGTMCPSFMVTREEEYSTRGRANALRAVLSGKLPPEEFTSERMYEVLDLCIECKGCKAECPSNVDMAKLKYEFLAHYNEKNGLSLRSWIFGNISTLNQVSALAPALANQMLSSKVGKWLLDRVVGIDQRRTLPLFAAQPFTRWFASRNGSASPGPNGTVVLFHDSFMTYNEPEIGIAATQLLEKAGFRVLLVDKRCCGRPMISKGMIEAARENARYNIEQLAPYAEQGIPIIGCEPSCLVTLRDEYLDLVDDPRAELVARHSLMIEEFLLQMHEAGKLSLPFRETPKKILLHGHCHQKAIISTAPSLQVLRFPPGFEVEEINSGCCGMAGAFGYEKEHYDFSMAIGEQRLFKAIRAKGPEYEIVAAGTSCRHQILQGTGRKPRHLVEVLLEAL